MKRPSTPLVVAAVAFIAMLTFLFVKTQRFDETDHVANLARLKHLKQLDAQSELDVLKSRTGINSNYDPLGDSLVELTVQLDGLEAALAAGSHDDVDPLVRHGAALRAALLEKVAAIERFKSENAVLQNSMAFLPAAALEAEAAIEVAAAVHGAPAFATRATMRIKGLLLACMLYSQRPSDTEADEIIAALRALDTEANGLPPEAHDHVELFGAHARTVVRAQVAVNALVAAIAAAPVAAHIDEIANLLSAERREAARRNERYREFLLVFSAALIGLVLYASVRLGRNHVVIRQKNEQLLEYGQGLEGLVAERVAELRESEARMTQLAQYDFLTGLPNRNLFRDRLETAIVRADREQRAMALMFVDLDHFKQINDSLGHVVGDAVLKAVAQRLRAAVRDVDTVARLGGDEFTIIVEGLASEDDAPHVAAKIKDALSAPLPVDARTFTVSASIGIALYPLGSGDGDALLQAADIAMYRAKDLGRNACAVFVPEMAVRISERVKLEMLLRHALERGEFELHYQPKLELATGRVAGVEALLRWTSAELGTVAPSRFIPVAEDLGLIVAIGEWVLRTACSQAAAWLREGLPPSTMAVNLSPRELGDPHLIERIASVLRESGLPPHLLELELTEGVIMDDVKANIDTLKAIRALGVSLAIDDFGTGYSSLAYLARLPIQTLKIDRAFIIAMLDDTHGTTLVATMVTLAHSLNLLVVAEGVETDAQQHALEALGCDQIQGYGFCRPVVAADAARLMRPKRVTPPRPASRVEIEAVN